MNGRAETITLPSEKVEKIEILLNDFCLQANTVWAILVTSAGHLIAQRGFVYSFDILGISALACGIFNSTMELARIIGEKKFNEFLQEGKKMSIYYITVNENYLLVSLFDDRTLPGVVKVASKEFSKSAGQILKGV